MSKTRQVINKGAKGDSRAKGNRGGSGRGNIKRRPCGCPSRQHYKTCVLSRSYSDPTRSVTEIGLTHKEQAILANAKQARTAKLARALSAKKRAKRRKKLAGWDWALVSVLPPAYTHGRFAQCVRCKGRGPLNVMGRVNPKNYDEAVCGGCL